MSVLNLFVTCLLFHSIEKVRSLTYLVDIYTSDIWLAGTDAGVYVQLYGRNGISTETKVDSSGNSHERNSRDEYTLNWIDVGTPTKLKVRHDNSGVGAGWHLRQVVVRRSWKVYYFDCNRWLDSDSGLSVNLYPKECGSLPAAPSGGSWVTEGPPYIVYQTAVMKCSSTHVGSTAYNSGATITCESYGSFGGWSSTSAVCCPVIQHCQSDDYQNCSSTYNTCSRCVDNKVFYKPWDNDHVCEGMCAYNSHYCWPGQCTDELTKGCTCAADFSKVITTSETSCQPTQLSSIETCDTVIVGANGEKKRAMRSNDSTQCQDLMDFYGNFQPVSVSTDVFTEFLIDISAKTKPTFIEESHFGVTDARVKLNKKEITGDVLTTTSNELKVDTAASTDVQRTFSATTDTAVPSSGFVLSNGQRLCVEYETHGGGYLKSKTPSGIISSAVPYQKTTASRELCYIYDSTPPEHCHQSGSCSTEPLYVSQRVTRSPDIPVQFQNWVDPSPAGGLSSGASGIESYQVTVHEVETSSVPLRVDTSNMFSKKVDKTVTSMVLNLAIDRPKLLCIALEVKDIADNVRQARRFVLIDNTSFIEIDESKDFFVSSASASTQYTWQTHHNPICLSWINYFYNRVYLDNPFLERIEQAAHGLITGQYDQITGKLPVSGTTNVHGIIKYEVSWNLENGNVFDSIIVADTISQVTCLNIPLTDGETYNLTLTASDITGNTLSDNKTLHIDRSVPHIHNISLIKDGYNRLFVHDTTDLSEMNLYFETLDPHSGIQTIHWKLATSDTRTELTTGATSVNIIEESLCPPDEVYCYCPDVGKCEIYSYVVPMSKLVAIDKHEGNHNRNYFFTLKVTNHAMLSNKEHLDILVDDSPPETGVVQEGPVGGGEIDYTSGDSLTVHWNGFIDHESGIKIYRVALARTCLDKTAFVNATVSADIYDFNEVPYTIKAFTMAANFTGKMFTTVVALNNAMDMSEAVCSDGVTRTVSPPLLENVTLMNAQWSEALACVNGSAWLLDSTLTKRLLNMTTPCVTVCTNSLSDTLIANILPTKSDAVIDEQTSSFLCERTPLLTAGQLIYLPHDKINMSWDAILTNSQVADFHVGIGISPSESSAPSFLGYHSTNKHTNYRKHHIGVGSDQTFYIFVKATNKAGLETITTIGPVLIDETPPLYRAKPTVELQAGEVVVGWEIDTFYDLEQTEPIHKIQLQFDHDGTMVSPLLEWTPQVSQTCHEYNGGCIKYPLTRLQTHDTDLGLRFVAKLFVYNRAGHFSTVNTEAFVLPSRYPPGHAIVSDMDPEHTDSFLTDVDMHTTNNTLCAAWRGFKHHENVTLELAIGTMPDSANVLQYAPVPDANYYCKTSPSLMPGIKYFVSIRASCSGGMTVSSSDGVHFFPEDYFTSNLNVSVGYECLESNPITVLATKQTSSLSFSTNDLKVSLGYRYALVPSYREAVLSINTHNGTIEEIIDADIEKYYLMLPYIEQPELSILCNSSCNMSIEINVYKCSSSVYLNPNSNLTLRWEFVAIVPPEMNYTISVLSIANNSTSSGVTLFTKGTRTGLQKFITNIPSSDMLPGKGYRMKLRPCIVDICMKAVYTDVFSIEWSRPNGHIDISEIMYDRKSCVDIHVKWRTFKSYSPVVVHQWAVVADIKTLQILTPWQPAHDHEGEFNIEECKHLPVHSRRAMYVCVRAFSEAGTRGQSCRRMELRYLEEYTSQMVYEFDRSTAAWKDVSKMMHSKLNGHVPNILHDAELDFGTVSSSVVGVVVYGNGRNMSWFLMRHPHVPEACDKDPACEYHEDNNESLVEIAQEVIERNNIYYVCAYSPRSMYEREYYNESLEEIKGCSNGFVIDDMSPTAGTVHVSHTGGYLTDLTVLSVEWDGFTDNVDATQLGYVHSIQHYSYAIGRRPGGDDIQNFSDVGLDTGVLLNNVQVRDGSSIYVTVQATDHVGLSASAVSGELFIDTTPPTSGHVSIQCGHVTNPTCSSYSIPIHISAFDDSETGIHAYELTIGSSCGLSNILSQAIFRDVVDIDVASQDIIEGHIYCINVKARNRAGLLSRESSQQFIIDTSPPTIGHVIDGPSDEQLDVDYQTDDVAHIAAHWRGFEDVQSGLGYYRVGLGLSPYTDDVEAMAYVGLTTEVRWNSTFTPGIWYYTTVEACNQAGVCRSLASDGILLDNSPPTPGVVSIGSAGGHRKFISTGSSVHIGWFGFEDPQSGIDRFDACIGTASGTCDVIPFFPCLLQSNIIRTGLNLSSNQTYYATVKSYNKIGLYVTRSSDSFRIDSSPPELISEPTFRTAYTSISGFSTQWDRSLLTIDWHFIDNDSPITHTIVTLKTHHEGHTPIETLNVGPVNEVTLQMDKDKWLSDGDRYIAVVTSCNAAGHCSSAESSDLIIDSTPPHLGGFKPPMTWHNLKSSSTEILANVTLTWYGFHDEESRIETYFVTVSQSYSGDDLTNGTVAIESSGTSGVGFTEQMTTVTLSKALAPDEMLILSIWARNEAGLNSSVARVSVNVLSTSSNINDLQTLAGFLEIEKHSCDIHFCNKDCTCAVIGQPCSDVITNDTCEVIESDDMEYSTLPDITVLTGMRDQPISLTASSTCLSAHWDIMDLSGNTTVERFEWSMGMWNQPVGEGIFDLKNQRPWNDVGQQTEIVHCLKNDYSLVHNEHYVVYLRVWYSKILSRIYTSEPILIDQTPPSIRRGASVKDSDVSCELDFDFVHWTTNITACWKGVFRETQSKIAHYSLALGTSPMADDVFPTTNVALAENMTINHLQLHPGTKYFITVTAYNTVGLHTSLSSDGFEVDTDDPISGVVFNTASHKDTLYQHSTTEFAISWHGFQDNYSGIQFYSVALVHKDANDMHDPTFINVGLRTVYTFSNLTLSHGDAYLGLVKATDAAGHVSLISKSDPKVIDTTPPVGLSCANTSELLISSVQLTEKVNVISKMELSRGSIFLIQGSASYFGNDISLSFDRKAVALPLYSYHSGTVLFEYSFISDTDRNTTLSLEVDVPSNETVTMKIDRCVTAVTDSSSGLQVHQTKPATFTVHMMVWDEESSVYKVQLGIGSTPGGFQVRGLSPIHTTNTITLHVTQPHGTTLYFTAIADNYAGLRSVFTSRPITVDRTSPVFIEEPSLQIEFGNTTDDNAVTVAWEIEDLESGTELCYCSLGHVHNPSFIQPFTAADSLNTCTFDNVFVAHGDVLVATVRCVNHVQLVTEETSNALVIALEQPDSDSATLEFISTDERSTRNQHSTSNQDGRIYFQSNNTCLQFEWTGFNDLSGIELFEYRLLHGGQYVNSWQGTGRETMALVNDVSLTHGGVYTAEVRAVNVGGLASDVTASDVIIAAEPQLTGSPIIVRQTGTTMKLDWDRVFVKTPELPCHFDVTVGTRSGYSDVFDMSSLVQTHADVTVGSTLLTPNARTMHISVTCVYVTGRSRSYRTSYNLV